jgi:glycosyltransferase involved in cell wall biosynthesis
MEQISPVHLTFAGKPLAAKEVVPPLVSIVVVNRNYGEYIGATLGSISRQDYPWFECIVVDNASTDDSRAVIERHTRDDPRFSTLYLAENVGLLGGALKVLDGLHGSFVAFVDADDLLFANYLSVHLQVHLALPSAVGFTSNNVIETDKVGRVVNSGRCYFGDGLRTGEPGLQAEADALRLSTICDEDYRALNLRVISVPHWYTHAGWAPGTANMYRKALIDIARPDPKFYQGHAGCDGYFSSFIHIMAGSALIFQPLSMYRYHDRNTSSYSPPLRTVSTIRSDAAIRARVQRRVVLRTLTADAERFNRILVRDRFWATINLLPGMEGSCPEDYFSDPNVQTVLVETFGTLSAAFGTAAVLWQLRLRMRFAVWRSFVSKLRQQAVQGVSISALLRVEAWHFLAKLGTLRRDLFLSRRE